MTTCWDEDIKDRPTFARIVERIKLVEPLAPKQDMDYTQNDKLHLVEVDKLEEAEQLNN
jgi:hypothetical protein